MLGDSVPLETHDAAPAFVDAKKVVRAQALAEGLSLLLVDLEALRLA